jgi:hypothetical protein
MKTHRGYNIRKTDTGGRTMGRVVWYIVDGINNSHHTTLTSAKQAIDFVLDEKIDEAKRDAIAAILLKDNVQFKAGA